LTYSWAEANAGILRPGSVHGEEEMSQISFLHRLTRPAEDTVRQIPRALVASVLAAALDMGLLVLFVSGAGWQPLPAATLSYLAGGILQYLLCALWVFPAAPQNATLGFTAFMFLSLVGLGITWVTIALLHDGARLNYALAKIAALGLAFAWNFLSRKLWIFKLAV
jgi:putative flippase GtrA